MTIEPTPHLIVIDDEPAWCSLLESVAEVFGYTMAITHSFEEAKKKMAAAEEVGQPFAVAIIDMNFSLKGNVRIEYPRGKEIIHFIKTHYPRTACIMVSGSIVSPGQVLDLRDDYDLDYFIPKDNLDIQAFDREIKKAIRRVELRSVTDSYERELRTLLTYWKKVYLASSQSLAVVREREAMKGIDVDVATVHERERLSANLKEAEEQIQAIQQKIDQLSSNAA